LTETNSDHFISLKKTPLKTNNNRQLKGRRFNFHRNQLPIHKRETLSKSDLHILVTQTQADLKDGLTTGSSRKTLNSNETLIHSFIHSVIYPFIHSFIHSFMQWTKYYYKLLRPFKR